MEHGHHLLQAVGVLAAAVLFVALATRAGLGGFIGYLAAGALVGPAGFGLVEAEELVTALAETGVALLLFTIGLELPFSRIRVMGARVLGVALAQVLATAGLVIAIALAIGLKVGAAVALGAALALSSTAIVIRVLSDWRAMASRPGRAIIAILVMQDVAVGPLLVIVTALGSSGESVVSALLLATLKMVVVIIAILGFGKLALEPVYSFLARGRDGEIFAGFTLLVVLGAGLVASLAGVSAGFGAFLAGMMLAESQYRHQVAADIMPFRQLLLGIFFITVGMSVDMRAAWVDASPVIFSAVVIILLKVAVVAPLLRLTGLGWRDATIGGVLLSQGGEFGFVMLGVAAGTWLLDRHTAQILTLAITLTMIVTPLLAGWMRRRWPAGPSGAALRAARGGGISEELALGGHIIVAGFGRTGRAAARELQASGARVIGVDNDPQIVVHGRSLGFTVLFGDASRPEVMAALHTEEAAALVVTLDNDEAATRSVALMRYVLPELYIAARAVDDSHAAELRRAGADATAIELAATGRELAHDALQGARVHERAETEPAPLETEQSPSPSPSAS